jgi:ActR/RegA family two-component response regulator
MHSLQYAERSIDMKGQKRVLLIEDMEVPRQTYADIISSAGYSVDVATNLQEAISIIHSKTFHVAVVDITLDEDDVYNRDGLKIIEYLHELGEGTESIILSGQDTVEVAVEAYERFNLLQYIEKRKLRDTSELTSAVYNAYEKCKINVFGTHDSVIGFLGGKNAEWEWVPKCITALHPAEGRYGLESFFSNLLTPFAPLLPKKGVETQIYLNEVERYVSGDFWSKAIGIAISVFVYPRKHIPESFEMLEANSREMELISKSQKLNLAGFVFALSNGDRSEFADRL